MEAFEKLSRNGASVRRAISCSLQKVRAHNATEEKGLLGQEVTGIRARGVTHCKGQHLLRKSSFAKLL